MKVLMTADTVGGVWTYALDLSRTLAAHGCEITLATMGGPASAAEAQAAARIRNLHLHESSYKLEWMDDPWDDVTEAGEWLLDLAQKVRPDIVHLNNFAHGALPWPAPVLMAGHSCVLSWWRAVKGESAPSNWDRYAAVVRRGIAAADLLVAPTQAMLDALRTHYGPLPSSQVIYNGRNPDLFRAAAKEPMILTVGRLWDEAKNVQALDRVAGAVPWPVYVAGEEHHPSGGQQHFTHVVPLGKLPPAELSGWFARAGIYALPARYEPFGLSVLEAALSGCALVLGDIPSLREVWGNAALYVAPDNPAAITGALVKLSTDDQLRTRLAHAAFLRGRHYTQSAMGAGYWQAYQTLLVNAALPARAAVHKQAAVSLWPPAAYQPSTQLGR
jgi:glycosyltransferase involved in cell wall biosynthesis